CRQRLKGYDPDGARSARARIRSDARATARWGRTGHNSGWRQWAGRLERGPHRKSSMAQTPWRVPGAVAPVRAKAANHAPAACVCRCVRPASAAHDTDRNDRGPLQAFARSLAAAYWPGSQDPKVYPCGCRSCQKVFKISCWDDMAVAVSVPESFIVV